MARAAVEAELDAVRAWAGRRNWTVAWQPEHLVLRASTYHPVLCRLLEVVAGCDSYRALPPAWQFVRPGTDEAGRQWFPAPGAGPAPGSGSIFHPNGVICAHWNRLAYAEHGGPHGDWGGPVAWLQVNGGNMALARSLADMLATIDVHLHTSPGMMA